MANNHAVVRTDRMFGTDNRAGLISIEYLGADGATPTAIDNGNVLKVGALESHGTAPDTTYEREIFVGAAVAADDAVDDIVLVASPEVMYDERLRNLDDFYNEAGKILRAYRLHKGDIFGVTKAALDGKETPAIDDVVELKAGTKLNVAASATNGATQVGKVIAVDVVGRYTYYVILIG